MPAPPVFGRHWKRSREVPVAGKKTDRSSIVAGEEQREPDPPRLAAPVRMKPRRMPPAKRQLPAEYGTEKFSRKLPPIGRLSSWLCGVAGRIKFAPRRMKYGLYFRSV